MADFRKWLLVLALVVFAASASAQPFSCAVTPGQPPILRDGGLTELVGDVVLSCTGGTAGTNATVNFQIFMNAPVTNDFSRSVPGLIVNEANGPTTVKGVAAPSNPTSSILFAGVVLPEPGTGPATSVRITNVRVAVPAASNTFIPTQVLEFVSTSPVGALPITNPTQVVGYVQPSFTFAVTGCDGSGAGTTVFQQCISQPLKPGALHFGVTFTELFPTAFKAIGSSAAQTVPGVAYNTESGLTFQTITDQATQGTRFIVKFTNVPTGVDIFVTDTNIGLSETSTPTGAAVIVTGNVDINGKGGAMATLPAGDQTASCGSTNTGTTLVAAEASGSTQYAVWEVADVGVDPNKIDTLLFGVEVSYTSQTGAGIPGLTTTPGAVTGTLAPISTDISQSKTAPIPRFNAAPQNGTTPFAIVPCVTNLLFPYVTSTAGYDTGIALVNTSLDNSTGSSGTPPDQPFATETQHGPCTVYFFGNMTIAPQITPDIPAGSLVKFTMLAPLAGWADTAGFEGYIIARCDFQFAHGLAFIVDTHVPGFGSEAYLALVIPDRASATERVPDPFTTCNNNVGGGAGCGEQLIH